MPKILLNELFADPTDASEMSSDSDNDVPSWVTEDTLKFSPSSIQELDSIIKEINDKLVEGTPVDLSAYPPLFVVNFRGLEFFKSFYTQEKRREVRREIKEQQVNTLYSPAVYELAGIGLGEPLDTAEKIARIKQAKRQLIAEVNQLDVDKPTKGWWSAAPVFDRPLYAHYQRYVNNYESFRNESKYKYLPVFQTQSYSLTPYISTSDNAIHAIHYATGAKASAQHNPLRPSYYDTNGFAPLRAKHPVTGYVEVIVHELHELAGKKPLRLSMLHAAKKLHIDSRILNEMETAFIGRIGKRHIVHREAIRYPSFHKRYVPSYHSNRYGIYSAQSYSRFKKLFSTNPGTASSKCTTLADKLAEHYAGKLAWIARKEVSQRKGFIVYITPEGLLTRNMFKTPLITQYRDRHDSLATQSGLNISTIYNHRLGLFFKPERTMPQASSSSSHEPEQVPSSSLR